MPLPNPWPEGELEAFLDHFLYARDAFLVDSIDAADADAGVMTGTCDTTRHLPIAELQRGDPKRHPRHVSAPELVLLTGNLGCLHAYFFHQTRWQEGWVGFGSRIHRADFKDIAHIGPPLQLRSEELRTRVGPKRVVLKMAFEFTQGGKLVYRGEQSAIFLKDPAFEA